MRTPKDDNAFEWHPPNDGHSFTGGLKWGMAMRVSDERPAEVPREALLVPVRRALSR
ncbi:hypothetical protein BN2475_1370019 [Paraburkholderia ribeironis]|uniref:Uncharacterized protein n=1 Tax=Paraburkholderia ribeironis TaxID=1247936 RepID=A0A1N7SPL5_9BURK|nr:hypothetical protein BN2475_1370019 [Paraburkholderia ribeironis]